MPSITSVSIHATLAGGDIVVQGFRDYLQLFLSTPPSRVATFLVLSSVMGVVFLSTPPSRVATRERRKPNGDSNVSIHATLAGGDCTA